MQEKTPCGACSICPNPNCRECRGLGYFTRQLCKKTDPCPVVGDPMTGGWECIKCGDSGPC